MPITCSRGQEVSITSDLFRYFAGYVRAYSDDSVRSAAKGALGHRLLRFRPRLVASAIDPAPCSGVP
jgi:hypothetical protein